MSDSYYNKDEASAAAPAPAPSERVRVRRAPHRAAYERETIYSILDETLICNIAYVQGGEPRSIPTIHVRAEDHLYLHGSAASTALRAAGGGLPLCLTATLLDGVVLARSALHHSVNYRSVVVIGTATQVTDPAEKTEALRRLIEGLVPGRWSEIRPPSGRELRATMVLSLPLAEASAKLRSGPPEEEEGDLSLGAWAGEIPIRLGAAPPVPDPQLAAGIACPDHVTEWSPGAADRRPRRRHASGAGSSDSGS